MSISITKPTVSYRSIFDKLIYHLQHPFVQFISMTIFIASATPYMGCIIEILFGVDVFEFAEELMKFISCFFGTAIAIASTLLFAIYEMYEYVVKYGSDMKIYYWNYFFFRIFCIGQHMIYLSVHLLGKKIASGYDNQETRIRIRSIALLIAWAYHMFHNEFFGKWAVINIFNIPL